MTAYRVRTFGGQVLGAVDSTSMVPEYAVTVALQRWRLSEGRTRRLSETTLSYAVIKNGSFLVVPANATIRLNQLTLASAARGATVLVDVAALSGTGSNRWELATVVKVGDTAVGEDGVQIEPTARATRPADSDHPTLSLGGGWKLGGEAEDGSVWFYNSDGKLTLRCAALSTAGALATGRMLVETEPDSDRFVVVDL